MANSLASIWQLQYVWQSGTSMSAAVNVLFKLAATVAMRDVHMWSRVLFTVWSQN